MCWIAKINEGNPTPYDYIDQAQTLNNDGYGVAWYDNGVHVFKSMDYTEFKTHLATIEGKLQVIHLRITSAGKTDISNAHPFPVPSGVLFHNGTITCLKTYGSACEDSDTNLLSQAISKSTYSKISDITPLLEVIIGSTYNKLVFLNNDGTVDILNQHLGIDDENGNWYSNTYHIKPKTHKVFVYGTLKKGFSNHSHLQFSKYLIPFASTVKKHAMVFTNGLYPFLLNEDSTGHHILGEVYEVSDSTLESLDRLEGTPYLYYRKEIEIIDDEDPTQKVIAWAYFKTNVTDADRNAPKIEEFALDQDLKDYTHFYKKYNYTLKGDSIYDY